MGLVACLKVVFDSGACGWSEMGLAAWPGQKKVRATDHKPMVCIPSLHTQRNTLDESWPLLQVTRVHNVLLLLRHCRVG